MDRLDAIMAKMGQYVLDKQVAGENMTVTTQNDMTTVHQM